MTLNHDDPRLTAYVLGELDDEGRRAVEAEIGHSPQVRHAVEEIRRTADLLSHDLAAEPCPAVDRNDHVYLQSATAAADAGQFKPMRKPRKQGSRAWLGWTAAGMAASACFVLVAALSLSGGAQAPSDSAISPPELLAQANAKAVGRSGGGKQSLPSAQAGRGTPRHETIAEQQTKLKKGEPVFIGALRDPEIGQVPSANEPPVNKAQTNYSAVEIKALRELREQRQAGILHSLGSVERSQVPSASEPPLGSPSAAEWRMLQSQSNRRAVELRQRQDGERGQGHIVTLSILENERLRGNKLLNRSGGDRPYQVAGQPTASPPVNQWRGAGQAHGIQMGEGASVTAGLQAPGVFSAGLDIPFRGRDFDGEAGQIGGFDPRHNTEAYDSIIENPFQLVTQNPLSTFSIDVDTASYANVRRFLNQNTLPPPGAVRIEELVNYFRYDYAGPEGDAPFATHAEVAECPWQPEHRLVRIGLKGREIEKEARPPSNLVFLLDVSGSMRSQNKLPLVKQGMRMLIEQLSENDRVAIVVYAGASGLVLDSMPGDQKESILASIDRLEAGGSTNGASGIQLAYQTAVANFLDEGTNRVILATDGDFNVGTTDQSQLVELIEEKAKSGVFLTVLGFGMGNLKDSTLEKLADKGNGNYAYIDSEREARKVLVEELSGTLITIAKDVKIQIEFNPAKVAAYRLIGYENRLLAKEDFNDDTKDAGEIGAGHTVTALYEIVPAGKDVKLPGVDDLEYQVPAQLSEAALESADLLTLKLRYKEPDGDTSKLLKFPVADAETRIGQASDDFQFAAAVAAFGMILRGSQYRGHVSLDAVHEMAQAGIGADAEGYRSEFIALVNKAKTLVPSQPSGEQSQEEIPRR